MFNPEPIIKQLETNIELFEVLLTNVDAEEANWKPKPGKWSIAEVLFHLADEECNDFQSRIKYALDSFDGELPPINPEQNVMDTGLPDDQTPDMLLNLFIGYRNGSIGILKHRMKKSPNWDNCLTHPELGKLSAKMFLTNWLVHDNLHIKQILSLRNGYLSHKTQQDISYAGGI